MSLTLFAIIVLLPFVFVECADYSTAKVREFHMDKVKDPKGVLGWPMLSYSKKLVALTIMFPLGFLFVITATYYFFRHDVF